jgi:hypothetical protein
VPFHLPPVWISIIVWSKSIARKFIFTITLTSEKVQYMRWRFTSYVVCRYMRWRRLTIDQFLNRRCTFLFETICWCCWHFEYLWWLVLELFTFHICFPPQFYLQRDFTLKPDNDNNTSLSVFQRYGSKLAAHNLPSPTTGQDPQEWRVCTPHSHRVQSHSHLFFAAPHDWVISLCAIDCANESLAN